MNIYATRDSGRLHIAWDQYYQGSINCYNNCLTQFVMRLLGLAQNITINGKTYCVNNASHRKYIDAGGSIQNTTVYVDRGYMRDHISPEKVEKRWKKMVLAIYGKNASLATKMLGKGADVNRRFVRIEGENPSFDPNIPANIPSNFIVRPLEFVGGNPFASELRKFGAV